MATRTHRSSTLVRRQALLEAAAQLVAEQGAGGVTHRAVAKRAGLPLSTTSYFFDSLDELVLEALRAFTAEQVAALETITASLTERPLAVDDVLDHLVDALLAEPAHRIVAQFESYLEASRREELRASICAVLDAYEALAREALVAAGADPAAAPAFVALTDGFALHRLVRGTSNGPALRTALRELLEASSR